MSEKIGTAKRGSNQGPDQGIGLRQRGGSSHCD